MFELFENMWEDFEGFSAAADEVIRKYKED